MGLVHGQYMVLASCGGDTSAQKFFCTFGASVPHCPVLLRISDSSAQMPCRSTVFKGPLGECYPFLT